MRTYTVILTALILSAAPVLAQTAAPAATPAKPAATMPATTPATPASTAKTTPAMTMPMSAVNVNTATEAQIAAIPGIGPKLAAAIVKARPFKNSAELIKKVKGIGPKNYLKLGLDKAFTY